MDFRTDDPDLSREVLSDARAMPPVHPGEVLLEDFLKPLAISQSALAADIRVPVKRVHEIVNRKRSITGETALLLGHYFGISPEFWMRLQAHYDVECAREAIGDRLEQVRVRKQAV